MLVDTKYEIKEAPMTELKREFELDTEIVAEQTMYFLRKISNNGNERTYAGKESTWKKYIDEPLNLESDFIEDLISNKLVKEESKSQERKVRFELVTDMWSKFMSLGTDYVMRVYNDMDRLKLLKASDREAVRISALSIAKYNLSDRQVKRLSQIFQKLEQETDYIFPTPPRQ